MERLKDTTGLTSDVGRRTTHCDDLKPESSGHCRSVNNPSSAELSRMSLNESNESVNCNRHLFYTGRRHFSSEILL